MAGLQSRPHDVSRGSCRSWPCPNYCILPCFFLDLRVRDVFFCVNIYLHANRNQFLMCCVLFSVSYLGKSVALAGCAKMIYRLPRWRKDSDGLNDAQIFGSCEHAHDREVNIEGRTSLYGV